MSLSTLAPKRLNVLVLDGGGVRGVSSLLILRDLMERINVELASSSREIKRVEPQDIFQLVAGTSTGGLITLMLGKLEMTVEECIEKYHQFSEKIFRKKRFHGKLTHGLSKTRYSGELLRQCVSELIESKKGKKDMPMMCENPQDRIACAVVCREMTSTKRYSHLKRKPACICNRPCRNRYSHSVCDAAQATTAAQTFFPAVHVDGSCYVDGGMEYNNPSQAIFIHYGQDARVEASRISSVSGSQLPSTVHHGNLDSSRVRYVNIGTGTKTEELPERKRDIVAMLLPHFIRNALHLKEILTQIAVDAENTADTMRQFHDLSHGDILYHRFSADTGVCYFKMDQWAELKKIESLTKEYLTKDDIQATLKEVAKELANDYLQSRSVTPTTPPTSAHAPVTESDLPNSQTPTFEHAPVMQSDLPNPQTPFKTDDTAKSTRPPLESGLPDQSGSSAHLTTTSSIPSSNLLGTTSDRSLSKQSTQPTETDADGPFSANDCQADKPNLDMTNALQAGSSAVVAVKG